MVWSIFLTFWKFLPWVAIAMVSAWSLMRNRESRALMFQALGAGCCFVLGIVQWLVMWLLGHTGAGTGVLSAASLIFEFLLFVALSIFAIGYCMERMRRQTPAAYPVTATPVER